MFIQTETTPNPATLKFLPGKVVMPKGTADFRDASTAGNTSPLAAKLFSVPGVTGVFFGYDFITVTKEDGEWQHLKPAILGTIMEHFMSGAPAMAGNSNADAAAAHGEEEFFDEDDAETVEIIKELIETHHIPRFRERHRVPEHEGCMLWLPVVDCNAEARHSEPPAPFRAGSAAGRTDLTLLRLVKKKAA